MRIIILGDLHFGVKDSSPIMINYMSKFFRHMFRYIDKHQIKTIVQLGDLSDKRKNINFLALHEAADMFFTPAKERDITVVAIAGNHDCYYKNDNKINSVRLLKQSNMIVIDEKPETVIIEGKPLDVYPWINESNSAECIKLAENPGSKFAFGHFEFANFRLHKNQIAETGMDHKLFYRYSLVFSGHYHCISRDDNILYVGTPYELDWSDHDDTKGFWILDTETSKLEFEKTPFRLYEKFDYDEDAYPIDFDLVQDKYIKLIIKNKKNQYVFDSFFTRLMSCNPYDVQIIDDEVIKAIDSVLGTDIKIQTTVDMINHVIENLHTSLDKNRLKSMIANTYEEALEIAKI